MFSFYYRQVARIRPLLAVGYDLFDLALRLSVGWAFFKSGLVKIRDFGATRALFRDEYRVPLLPTDVAAVLGTAAELVLPALLALGIFTRLAAGGLFVFNVMAVVAYWHVLRDLEPALAQHYHWGAMLLVPLLAGPGRGALDYWLGPGIEGAARRTPA
jgi:putative oxidoreductase